jgi:hypothetical protein
VGRDWVHLVRRPLVGMLLHQPRVVDLEYGAVGAMRISRGNRSTRRKSAPVLLCPLQIPHDLTWARTRAAAVGSRRLTAWAMAVSLSSDTDIRSNYIPSVCTICIVLQFGMKGMLLDVTRSTNFLVPCQQNNITRSCELQNNCRDVSSRSN